jgi:hypothetical protein
MIFARFDFEFSEGGVLLCEAQMACPVSVTEKTQLGQDEQSHTSLIVTETCRG